MKHILPVFLCLFLLLVLAACTNVSPIEPGVSRNLARERATRISDLRYDLTFSIPASLEESCSGEVILRFELSGKGQLQLDFRPGAEAVHSLVVNGRRLSADMRDEHIVIPGNALQKGPNEVTISFTPDDAPLNRRPEFLYSLLVPDRARTLFPCFDQPDLKARFSLTLDIPEEWVAVSNGAVQEESLSAGRKHIRFEESAPLPTYLFSFAAGKWNVATFDRDGQPVHIYYRETDPEKLTQLPEIFRQIDCALDWMEDYTGIAMPFPKYDCVIVPGFQFGGMEHPGSILFNETRMFLGEAPTDVEKLSRTDLISHETAHLWFGDAVTMEWFDDVWTKEVFAGHFAAQITRPLFPDIDFRTMDFRNFNIRAYEEDRTAGTTPIRQRLDNLQDAGLIYSNIVYDKSPVVMRMLADTLGADAFRKGLQEYLHRYLYGNATWPALIEILDQYTDADLKAWSHQWVEEKGMPAYPESDFMPNLSALGYGYYPMSGEAIATALARVTSLEKPYERLSTLVNLYENMLHGRLTPEQMLTCLEEVLLKEKDPLVASSALGYLTEVWRHCPDKVEALLHSLAKYGGIPEQVRLSAFRSLVHLHTDTGVDEELWQVWFQQQPWPGLQLSAEDYNTLACELALRRPADLEQIHSVQRSRITNTDRLARFDYVWPSLSPDKVVRDSVFASLLEPGNRSTEPWAQESLRLLNHPLRQQEALGYIVPALDEMQEIQRTGDIFFPKNWIVATLSGHDCPEATALVRNWLDAHPDYPVLLKNKILQAADPLLREYGPTPLHDRFIF
jgi:aminopeptidase N